MLYHLLFKKSNVQVRKLKIDEGLKNTLENFFKRELKKLKNSYLLYNLYIF